MRVNMVHINSLHLLCKFMWTRCKIVISSSVLTPTEHEHRVFLFMFHSGGSGLYEPWPAAPRVVLLSEYCPVFTSPCIVSLYPLTLIKLPS